MTTNPTPETPQPGMQVYGSDEDRLGDVRRIENDQLVVNTGLLRDDLYIPVSMVDRVDQGRVVLTMPKATIEAKDWTVPPEGNTMTVSGQPAEDRPDALNEVSTSASPGRDAVVDADTDAFDDRPDMDSNRRPDDR